MTYLYLAYHQKQNMETQALIEQLMSHGFDVWGGDASGVEECSVYLLLMTPEAGRDASLVHNTQRARRYGKPILPLLLAGDPLPCCADLPYIDFRQVSQTPAIFWERLLTMLSSQSGPGNYLGSWDDDDDRAMTSINRPPWVQELTQVMRANMAANAGAQAKK